MFKLKEVREAKGLTQTELASKSNVSRTLINLIENNKATSITTDTLHKLAESLGCNPSDLIQ